MGNDGGTEFSSSTADLSTKSAYSRVCAYTVRVYITDCWQNNQLVIIQQEAFEKMLGPFATASRYIAIHQVSLLSHAATVALRLRIDVHNDDDNNNNNDNDNAWQRGPLWPHRMDPIIYKTYTILESKSLDGSGPAYPTVSMLRM